ncbi:phosphotransferase family protein [Kutzneria chonburiensis]|uniref:Phosphotransferase family protein n=1 Tax=Kutzneria chonburiensis TaxID=1483604 RepID=A0ABV6NAF7_9PSEU|nr:phosphotransferase [Kutzneria chonburiensis]
MDFDEIAAALGGEVVDVRVLAGGFSHQTSLLTLTTGPVVVRVGGTDHEIEAAVMAAAARDVPVPAVLKILPTAMVLEYVEGTPLSEVLDGGAELGAEVGRVAAAVGAVTFDRPGFFADATLTVQPQIPWSQQLSEFAETCMAADTRLDAATRKAWTELCAANAPALAAIDGDARLVHADLNPKNILVARDDGRWRVAALLDWEFSFAGCPYADAANMLRFGADYPVDFVDGFTAAFAEHLPAGPDWRHLGRVLDMFALSDLVTRPAGHPVADRAALEIRRWVAQDRTHSFGWSADGVLLAKVPDEG